MASYCKCLFLIVYAGAICLYLTCPLVDAEFDEGIDKRLRALEAQGREQAETIQRLETRMQAQNERLATQEDTITEYKQRVIGLELVAGLTQNKAGKPVLDDNKSILKARHYFENLRNMELSAEHQMQKAAGQGNRIRDDNSMVLDLARIVPQLPRKTDSEVPGRSVITIAHPEHKLSLGVVEEWLHNDQAKKTEVVDKPDGIALVAIKVNQRPRFKSHKMS